MYYIIIQGYTKIHPTVGSSQLRGEDLRKLPENNHEEMDATYFTEKLTNDVPGGYFLQFGDDGVEEQRNSSKLGIAASKDSKNQRSEIRRQPTAS